MRTNAFIIILLAAACTGEITTPGGGADYAGDPVVLPEETGEPPGDEPGEEPTETPEQPEPPPPPAPAAGPYFNKPMFWNQDVSAAPKAANSASIISALKGRGGWGANNVFRIDFSISVHEATASTPKRTFTKNSDFFSPDCDHVAMPVPPGGNVEGNSGYACQNGGDCHLIVFDRASGKLYEQYKASITSSSYSGGCLAVWDTAKAYGSALRGDQCTSADAAGFPIAPLLFTADEVKAGEIKHAIRFILPNNRVRQGYVRPATHATNTSGGTNAPYYGVHLRLRADYPIAKLPSQGAKVVARALQRYGMYHADGGEITLTAQSDRTTAAKWAGLLGEYDLSALKVEDFEVIDHGAALPLGYNCKRQ